MSLHRTGPRNRFHIAVLAAVPGLLAAAPVRAQLTLGEAFRQADRSAYGNRIAAGTAATQQARTLAPLTGILGSLRFEARYVRTTDPIGVFASTLRQRAVSQTNFDPQRLNYPGAIGNYQTGVVVEQPIFNADAWTGRRAAVRAAGASRAQEEWTRLSTRVDVVRAYYGAVLAAERATTLQSAARAAHAHVTQSEAMVRQGLVTKSDALLASVRAGDIDAQLADAEGGAETARRQPARADARTVARDGVCAGKAGRRGLTALVSAQRRASTLRRALDSASSLPHMMSHSRKTSRSARL